MLTRASSPPPGGPTGPGSYYPPRARWYSGLGNLAYLASRKLGVDTLCRRLNLTAPRLLVSVALPGGSYLVLGRRRLGLVVLAVYGVAGVFSLICLGGRVAPLATGAMIALHGLSVAHLLTRWPTELSPRTRVAASLGIFLAAGLLIYAPLRAVLQHHFFLPLRVGDRVVVVSVLAPKQDLQRGDLIAFRIRAASAGNVRLQAGYGMGRIQAMAGDQIRFGEDAYTIRGVTRPQLVHMPRNQTWGVPENHWFIWPDSAIKASGNANADGVSRVLQELALVPESDYAGKPFARWFGRRQVEP